MLEGELEPDGSEVWPDNVRTVEVFLALSTQWRIGPGGEMYGLDYAALPAVLELCDVPPDERRDVFEGVRVMEREAIDVVMKRRG